MNINFTKMKIGTSVIRDFFVLPLISLILLTASCKTSNGNDLDNGNTELLPGDDLYYNHNGYYNVYIFQDNRWKSVEVRNALVSDAPNHHPDIWNDWGNAKKLRDTMSYAIFTDNFDAPLKVRVENRRANFEQVKVRPTSYEFETTRVNETTIEFTIDDWSRRKVSVEFDDNRYNNLFLFPNREDDNKPDPNDPNVTYFAAGEHNVGHIELGDNETLYIDEGAVVYAHVSAKGNNIKITGRGILSGEKLPHIGNIYAEGPVLVNVSNTRNFTLSGVTLIDSPSWSVALFDVSHVTIDNMNMICWILNGDGIDLCSVDDAVINDCFIRTYDDCISLKVLANFYTDVNNIRVTNSLLWTDYARGVMVGPESGDYTWGTGKIKNCIFENCIFLEQPSGDGDYRSAIAVVQHAMHGGGAALIDHITFRNIEIDHMQQGGRPICLEQAPQRLSSTMQNIIFENIRISDSKGHQHKSSIRTNDNQMKNIVFNNVTYNGQKITGAGDRLEIEGNVEISFK